MADRHSIDLDAGDPAIFADALRAVIEDGERVELTIDGAPVAVIIPAKDLAYFEALEDAVDHAAADDAKAESSERVSDDELRVHLGLV